MRKLLFLIVLFLLAVLLAEAQTPCSYVKNEIDPFTGDVIKVTSSQDLHNHRNTRVSFSFARVGDERLMIIDLYTSQSVCFRADNIIIILPEEGEPHELIAIPTGGTIDCGKHVSTGIRRFRFMTYLDDDLLQIVPKAIRFNPTRSYITITEFRGSRITPPNQIMMQAGCIE